jgi:hypothetical protein
MYEPFSRQVKVGNWESCKEKSLFDLPYTVGDFWTIPYLYPILTDILI